MDKAGGVFENGAYNQLYLLSLINDSNLASLQAALGEAGSGLFVMNFQFLGLDLSLIPTWKFWTGGPEMEFDWPVSPALGVHRSVLPIHEGVHGHQQDEYQDSECPGGPDE